MDGGRRGRTDGVRADPLRVVKDAVYSWRGWMDGGRGGRRAWGCERKKKKKKKFYLCGWVAVDACGWWLFRRAVAVVAVYTVDVEEEKKKKKKEKEGLLVGVGG